MNPVTKIVGPGSTKSSQTLYDRMGGEAKLEAVVNGVYQAMKADVEIGKPFARFRIERLKDRTVDYLRGEFGGTEYKGSDLWISHSHIGISNHWYDIMMGYYAKVLKKERIPKQETAEILEALEKMRAPCVDPGLKFKNMYLAHIERQDAKAEAAAKAPPKAEKEQAAVAGKVLDSPGDPALSAPKLTRKKSGKEVEAVSEAKSAAGEGKSARGKRRSKEAPGALDPSRFAFVPKIDGPPELCPPSSLPSGAELLYRLSVPCRAPSAPPPRLASGL